MKKQAKKQDSVPPHPWFTDAKEPNGRGIYGIFDADRTCIFTLVFPPQFPDAEAFPIVQHLLKVANVKGR